MFSEYDNVTVKKSGKKGTIVYIDTDGGTKPPIYFVEIEQEEKTGNFKEDMIWCNGDELMADLNRL